MHLHDTMIIQFHFLYKSIDQFGPFSKSSYKNESRHF